MISKRLKISAVWIGIFTLIFLMSLNFWAWDDPVKMGVFFLPRWIYYFIALQLLLVLALAVFAFGFWHKVFDKEE